MEKYLVAIFRNSDRLRYDLTRVAYPRYFAAGTRSIIMLPVAPLIFDHGVPTRFELFSVDRGRDLFPVKRLREERIPPSFHFHLLSKHWYKWNIRDIIDNSFFLLFLFERCVARTSSTLLINYFSRDFLVLS